jgi:hypothetical protein
MLNVRNCCPGNRREPCGKIPAAQLDLVTARRHSFAGIGILQLFVHAQGELFRIFMNIESDSTG